MFVQGNLINTYPISKIVSLIESYIIAECHRLHFMKKKQVPVGLDEAMEKISSRIFFMRKYVDVCEF